MPKPRRPESRPASSLSFSSLSATRSSSASAPHRPSPLALNTEAEEASLTAKSLLFEPLAPDFLSPVHSPPNAPHSSTGGFLNISVNRANLFRAVDAEILKSIRPHTSAQPNTEKGKKETARGVRRVGKRELTEEELVDARCRAIDVYHHHQQLAQVLAHPPSSSQSKPTDELVSELTAATRRAHRHRLYTDSLIALGLRREGELTSQWVEMETQARAINRSAERAARRDQRESVRELVTYARAGRVLEAREKEKEAQQHLVEAVEARNSRRRIYSDPLVHLPPSRMQQRQRAVTAAIQGEKCVGKGAVYRQPLFDPVPQVDEFKEHREVSVDTHHFRDVERPQRPDILPPIVESMHELMEAEEKARAEHSHEPRDHHRTARPAVPHEEEKSQLPAVQSSTVQRVPRVIPRPPSTAPPHESKPVRRPLWTQSDGDAMLAQVCLFTLHAKQAEDERKTRERAEISEAERLMKQQWIDDELKEKAEADRRKHPAPPSAAVPASSAANDSQPQPARRFSVAGPMSRRRSTIALPHANQRRASTVLARPQSVGEEGRSTPRSVSSIASAFSQSFPTAQVRSRWQNAAGMTGKGHLARRFSAVELPTDATVPVVQLLSTPPSSALTSLVATNSSHDPLHSSFLISQREARRTATAAVYDTVKCWLQQQADSNASSIPLSHTYSPRTLHRHNVMQQRLPLSIANPAVFAWLKKHRIPPRRTVDPSEEVRYRQIFNEIDRDHSGLLDTQELLSALHQTHGLRMSEKELHELMSGMDIAFEGFLTFQQFVSQFASMDEWESLFHVWERRRTQRSSSPSPSQSSDTGPGPDVLVPFLLWVPAFHRMKLMESLMSLSLTPDEQTTILAQDSSPYDGIGLSLLDLWRLTRTQVRRSRAQADRADVQRMTQMRLTNRSLRKKNQKPKHQHTQGEDAKDILQLFRQAARTAHEQMEHEKEDLKLNNN